MTPWGGKTAVTSSRCGADEAKANCGDGTASRGDAAALSATAQLPHTGLWRVECLRSGSVSSSFGLALPPSPCLLLLWWLVLLLPTLCRLPRPLSPPCILPSAPLPAAASPAAGAPWIRCGHWSQSGRGGGGCYRNRHRPSCVPPLMECPRHLVQDVLAVSVLLYITESGFAFVPLKVPTTVCIVLRMQTFFLGFTWYTVRAASFQHRTAPLTVSRRRNSRFCLAMVPTRLYNTTI